MNTNKLSHKYNIDVFSQYYEKKDIPLSRKRECLSFLRIVLMDILGEKSSIKNTNKNTLDFIEKKLKKLFINKDIKDLINYTKYYYEFLIDNKKIHTNLRAHIV